MFYELCFTMLEQHEMPAGVRALPILPERNQHHNERDERLPLQLVRLSHQTDVERRQYRQLGRLQEPASQICATFCRLRSTGRRRVPLLSYKWPARGRESDPEEAFALPLRREGLGPHDRCGKVPRALVHEPQN